MSNFKLNLPTDIPWKRVCVTQDMVDQVVCDANLPPKWHSSLAAFKYIPEDEYQSYPDYKITYLKVTATITGYQPMDQEIQGEIDWDGLSVGTREGITELLSSYHPCNGAILQVVVGPKGNNPTIPKEDYPFFLDFEPKKRELYELATDTKEKQSRSIETLNVTKSNGQTASQEVMDVDMGGSTSFGISGQGGGTGGGLNIGSSSQGQWGTKQLNSNESMETRTTDSGQEKRESYSFTTQISQMYNQLTAYHIGTNRAIFFVEPRPHVLEVPSGFVRGPRAVEGIQEFFLVVAQPRNQDQEDFCLSLRLDTAHLTTIPVMDYERIPGVLTDMALAIADLPTSADTVETRQVRCKIDYWAGVDDIYYNKHVKTVSNSAVYQAPNGFRIEDWADAVNNVQNGTSNVTMAPDGKTLSINVQARSSVWIQDEGDGWFADCPDKIDQKTGRAERRLRVDLISTSPIKQVGIKEMLLITTRGVCCCPDSGPFIPGVLVRGARAVPSRFRSGTSYEKSTYVYRDSPATLGLKAANEDESMAVHLRSGTSCDDSGTSQRAGEDCGCKQRSPDEAGSKGRAMSIRQANEMIGFIKDEILKGLVDPLPENAPKPFIETDFFVQKLQAMLSNVRAGRKNLHRNVGKELPPAVREKLAARVKKKPEELTVIDFLTLTNHELSTLGKMSPQQAARLKLENLGIRFRRERY